MSGLVFYLDFYVPGSGVAEGTHQGFATDAVDFIADDRVQRAGAAFDSDAKINLLFDGEFLPNAGKCLLDVKGAATGRSAEALKSVAAFFKNLTHDVKNMGQRRLRRQILGQMINRDVKLHRGADDTLQQRVMEFLRDFGSLGESFFEAELQLFRHTV